MTIPVTLGSYASESVANNIAWDMAYAIGAAAILLAAWLVIRRPSTMTWSLYAFLLSTSNGDPQTLNRFGWTVSLIDNLVIVVLSSAFAFIIVFAARAPNNTTSRWKRWVELGAIGLFFVSLADAAYPMVSWSIFGVPQQYAFPPAWIGNAITPVVVFITAVVLAVNYLRAQTLDRERLKWIILGVVLAIAPKLVFEFGSSLEFLVWTGTALTLVTAVGIGIIAYAIIKGRIVDVKFLVSRAVVVTLLAGSIVIVFALVDWIVTRNLQATRLGAVAEIGLAIALGFWFNALHRNVDAFVDRVLFRKRHLAERQLTLASHAVLHCTSVETIREVLVDEPATALELASAAIFEPIEASTWRRTREIGWGVRTLSMLKGDDALLLRVKAEQTTLRLSSIRWKPAGLPVENCCPLLAVPVLARRNVVAIVLYGLHSSGVDLDLDEIRSIERVAEAAGAAYDHVEAETFRRKYEELESRLAHVQ
jgi:hypothetical protein